MRALTGEAVYGKLGSWMFRKKPSLVRPTALLALCVISGLVAGAQPVRFPTLGGTPLMPDQVTRRTVAEVQVKTLASKLEIPWQIRFMPDGRLLFTERPGRIKVMHPTARGFSRPSLYLNLTTVVSRGEGGLMGMALHPQFPAQPYLYVMYTWLSPQGAPFNRISRLTDTGATAVDEQILLDGIPAAQLHNGGALAFGPDGMLYAGTGDARQPGSAQDPGSLSGKILRLTPAGAIPADNPNPASPVYAYGFRNVSGLAWHPQTGELWAASHGPSGEFEQLFARDAIYVVRRGGNHGWPLLVGTSSDPLFASPVLYYPTAAVPPGGIHFYTGDLFPAFKGNLFLATLGSMHLQRIGVSGAATIASIERWWPSRFGRLRSVTQGPDGALYLSTSNRDGRAPRGRYPGSDRIFRLTPKIRR